MNQGKLEVVKQEMARVNIGIRGISELRCWKQLSVVVNPEGFSPFVTKQITLFYKRLTRLKYRQFILEYIGHIVILRSTTAE